MAQVLKRRTKASRKTNLDKKVEKDVVLDISEAFGPAQVKEGDFDLSLDSARWQGKKGQAGSRSKS